MSRQQTSMQSEPACFGSTMLAAAVLTRMQLLLLGSPGCAGSMVEGPGSGVVDVSDVTFKLLNFSLV